VPRQLAIALSPVSPALLALALGSTAATAGAQAGAQVPSAGEARALEVTDRAELHLSRASGNTLTEEGKAGGTLSGNAIVKLTLDVERRTATSRFTLYLRGGSLKGEARGKASRGLGGWESFGGMMSFAGGSGRYAHATGSGNMYGAINRGSDRLKVQVIGQLRL